MKVKTLLLTATLGMVCTLDVYAAPSASGSALAPAPAPALTGAQILQKVDHNLTFDTRTAVMTMTVAKRNREKQYELRSFSHGAEKAAIEFAAPARDKGTKLLKLEDQLWMYLPAIEKVLRISGHMTRQGLMGSDFSYEDIMEANALARLYDVESFAASELDERKCWRLMLRAKGPEVTYARRVMWVDQQSFVPLKQEMYAASGGLIKVWTMSDIRLIGNRYTPLVMQARDMISGGSETTIKFLAVEYSVKLPTEVFSKRWLER